MQPDKTLARTRSVRRVVSDCIHSALDALEYAEEPRLIWWDGRLLRMHRLTSRKARQIMHEPDAFPGLLGVYDHRALYSDLAEPLEDLLGVPL
ncbi:hypothetical protein [Paludibacterium paludis]|uniref:Uncharacterized protein n=1 Tax=Paludibacterium paludis TaxID=1225769 RepID=A0A918P313_9NEIS|nr:hypothetical protein [Paludibacterium paludis]GGY15935.1 hypothetical protein GCM10011289_19130 [Paludibacterium paludis]